MGNRFKIQSDEQFADSVLVQLPKEWARVARQRYTKIYEKNYKAGNLFILDLKESLEDNAGAFALDCNDDDLINLSIEITDKVSLLKSDYVKLPYKHDELMGKLQTICVRYRVRFPSEHDRAQQLARLSCPQWWLRGLRVAAGKFIEGMAIDAGLVHKKQNVYCSDDTVQRRDSQKRRNLEALEGVEMVSLNTGQIMSLAEIAATNNSSVENRRNELLTRVKGFEELAYKYKHAAEFITITCPPRMHAVLANGQKNPKYDGTKPDMAQRFLVDAWARVRAHLKRENVKFYGLRIAEPHHDATPHWHMILFYRKDESTKNTLRWTFAHYFLADAFDENITPTEKYDRLKNGLKFVGIASKQGSPVGYVLKYVLKNVGGLDDGQRSDEAPERRAENLYPRVEAWAATWRIRQFQQIGGHYVSVWRELRRIDEAKIKCVGERFKNLWQACQKRKAESTEDYILANFAQFIEGMGGLETPPREGLYRVDYDYIDKKSRYGDAVIPKVLGVGERFGREVAATNRAEWLVL